MEGTGDSAIELIQCNVAYYRRGCESGHGIIYLVFKKRFDLAAGLSDKSSHGREKVPRELTGGSGDPRERVDRFGDGAWVERSWRRRVCIRLAHRNVHCSCRLQMLFRTTV